MHFLYNKKILERLMSKKIEDKYKVLSHIDHILLRPQTYLGSNKPHTSNKYLYDSEKGMVKEEITYIPSFLKIFDEIITNSVDEHKRGSSLNRIDITVDKETGVISVKDNGGIPVVLHKEHNQYVPEVIFGNLMSGSNYDDTEERIVAGTNGLGGKLTNVFSKEFTVKTCDGKNSFIQVFSNNMRDRTVAKVKRGSQNFTEITYLPDYERFNIDGMDDYHYKMINKRVVDIAGCNPDIKIYFNGKIIQIKSFNDYVSFYKPVNFFESSKDKSWSVAISSSEDGFQQISFVNSTDTYDGGTHVDYIMNQIVSQIREFFLKKHKVDVKPSEIKNHIFLFLNSTVINPSFSSQTKEKLITEVKDFGFEYKVTDKFIKSILKSDIMDSILDWVNQKKNADENKLARELNKNLSKIKVDKLIDAKGRDRWKCSMGIFEGDSAISAFRKYRDPQSMGAFALKGKFLNVTEIPTKKLLLKKPTGDYVYNEVINLMGSIGLKLGEEPDLRNLRYGKILFYVDADVDGNSIAGLLLNFFHKYWPQLFDRNMVYKVETPIVVSINKKSKKKNLFYSQVEYNEWSSKEDLKNWEIKYKKGLAALVDDEYNEIINNPKLTLIKRDEMSEESLDVWFGKNTDLRKVQILN